MPAFHIIGIQRQGFCEGRSKNVGKYDNEKTTEAVEDQQTQKLLDKL